MKGEVDELKDGISELKDGLKTRPEKEEVVQIINSKGSPDEFFTDIQNITSNVSRLLKEFKLHKTDCQAFNEAQLRDNCFGRWLWTRADLVNPGDFLAWDTESANTNPQTLRWWKP